jgi:asparagine synthase (glutamine-hydrolysing)
MCGIAGIFAYSTLAAPVDPNELVRIRDHMQARGPDAADMWIAENGRVGFAHRRLAIIDLSPVGGQPMHDPDTGNCIVFNGEIYNHHALRAQLNRDGIATRSLSDTEVLLKLYAQIGPAVLTRLRGMFAMAIWDARQQHMFFARDLYGIKPLYIADDGRTLRFASQVKALLVGTVDTRPEPAGHAGFLLWGSVPEPYTLYRGICAFPPGHWMTVAEGGSSQPVPFDSLSQRLARLPTAAPQDASQTLYTIAEAVRDSVAAHMVADVPVGVFLSAGLDSTMLAACAAKLGELRSVTLGFDEYTGTAYDEAALADEVAQSLGAQHTLHRISGADFAKDRAHMLQAMDQPSIDGINTWFVSKAAASQGLKVALSGIGGDELFGSYPSFAQVPKLYNTMRHLGGIPLLNRTVRKGLAAVSGLLPSPKYAGMLEYGSSLGGAYLLRRALYMPWEIASVLGREMAAEGLQHLDTQTALAACKQGIGSQRLAITALESQWFMRNQLLRDADWAGMAHSLELRVPFVDTTLLDSFIEIPSLSPAQEKAMIARMVAPELPEAILNRPKTGFAVPIHQWLNPGVHYSINSHREWAGMLYQEFTQGQG